MIYIIQCLCHRRHAIYAIAYDPKDIAHDTALAGFQQMIEAWVLDKMINPWCAICESRVWMYEQRPTRYQTMEEARPELERLELENRLSRVIIDQTKAQKN